MSFLIYVYVWFYLRGAPFEVRENIRSSGAGATGGWEPPDMGAGNRTLPIWKGSADSAMSPASMTNDLNQHQESSQ